MAIILYPSKFSNFSCFSIKLTIESLNASLLELNPLKFRTFSNLSNKSSLICNDIIGIIKSIKEQSLKSFFRVFEFELFFKY